MKIQLMHSYGKNDIDIYEWDKPEITDDEIEVKTKLCGICRSDIAAYSGWENPMPLGMFGHEGVGIVSKVGKNVKDIKEGDFVATWSDPAYGEYYNAKQNQFTKIPEIDKKYIMQPTACAINIWLKTYDQMYKMGYVGKDVLLIGTGFMSLIIGQIYKDIHVLGKSNEFFWNNLNIPQYKTVEDLPKEKYKVIIDLSSKAEYFDIIAKQLGDIEALITYASTPFTPVTTNFFENCWNCHTFIMPSPRNLNFNTSMTLGVDQIYKNTIKTDILWTKGYKAFNLEDMKRGFEDGKNRTPNYLRGYFIYE